MRLLLGFLALAFASTATAGQLAAPVASVQVDRNRGDGVVTGADWLDLLEEKSGTPALRGRIEELLGRPHPDAQAALDSFILGAGIADEFAPAAE